MHFAKKGQRRKNWPLTKEGENFFQVMMIGQIKYHIYMLDVLLNCTYVSSFQMIIPCSRSRLSIYGNNKTVFLSSSNESVDSSCYLHIDDKKLVVAIILIVFFFYLFSRICCCCCYHPRCHAKKRSSHVWCFSCRIF